MPIIMTNIEKRDAERTNIVDSYLIKMDKYISMERNMWLKM